MINQFLIFLISFFLGNIQSRHQLSKLRAHTTHTHAHTHASAVQLHGVCVCTFACVLMLSSSPRCSSHAPLQVRIQALNARTHAQHTHTTHSYTYAHQITHLRVALRADERNCRLRCSSDARPPSPLPLSICNR